MIGEARAALANRGDEISRPLNRRPTADETTVWTTRKASGWAQQVEVMFRDRDTNAIIARPYFLTGRQLRSRQFVIDEAMGIYNPEGTDGDRQQLLGAIYTGTYRMIPE